MAEYFDGLETRDPAERERDLMAMLPRLLARAKAEAPYYARLFAQVDAASIASRTALAALPVTRKARSEEHTSELQSLMRTSYAVFCLKKKTPKTLNGKYSQLTTLTHSNNTY